MDQLRKQAQRTNHQKNNRNIHPSTSSDFPLPPPQVSSSVPRKNIPNGTVKKIKETKDISLDTDEELSDMKLISDNEHRDSDSNKDLSFTLPKPINLKPTKVRLKKVDKFRAYLGECDNRLRDWDVTGLSAGLDDWFITLGAQSGRVE